MRKKKRREFPIGIKRLVMMRSGNRCERCNSDFNEGFTGEFHHIIAVSDNGDDSIENCSLLCRNCQKAAPRVLNEIDKMIYKHYFLRFASYREAAAYYKAENKMELYVKLAQDIASFSEEHDEL
jgi:hypothetical protein